MSDAIMGFLPDGTPVTCDNMGRVVPMEKPATVQAMGVDGCTYEVSLAVASGPHRFVCGEPLPEPADRRTKVPKGNKCDICGGAFDRIHVCPEPMHTTGLPNIAALYPKRAPADRRIVQWMPAEYMEAARAGEGKPDALEVAEKRCRWRLMNPRRPRVTGAHYERFPPQDDPVSDDHGPVLRWPGDLRKACGFDAPEPTPEPEDSTWLVTPADLRETRGGKGLGSGERYDFEEVP